jgi:lipoate-protein ligase A
MSKTKLHLLPVRSGAAAENMALDFLLLQRYPAPAAPRFRHYEWRTAAFTFGYSQKIVFVRANLPPGESFDLCRRPTGGGLVDHRNDWTYTLALPRGHALCDARATEAYRAVHAALVEALVALGQPAELKTEDEPSETGSGWPADLSPAATAKAEALVKAGVCFQRAELYDVVNRATGAKIAGAAMKRNQHGLMLQGSIEKNSVGPVDWENFGECFSVALGQAIRAEPVETPWPELNEDEVSGLIEHYSTPEWIEYR